MESEIKEKKVSERKEVIDKVIAERPPVELYFELQSLARELSEIQKIKAIEKIISENNPALAYCVLRYYDITLKLQKEALNIINSRELSEYIPPRTLEIIQEILGDRWISFHPSIVEGMVSTLDLETSLVFGYFPGHKKFEVMGYGGIPVFPDVKWTVKEKKNINGKELITGALLEPGQYNRYNTNHQVILFKDVNGKGYAFRADPKAITVKEAIAIVFGLDPKNLK